jgi:hypothetical protein
MSKEKEMTDEPKEKINEETAFYEWERNMKDDCDDQERYEELFGIEANATHEEIMKEFYYYCSNYYDLKHIKEGTK